MGNKYSSVYQHNTASNLQLYLADTNKCHQQEIQDIADKIKPNGVIIKNYSLRQTCKLCYQSMYNRQILMIYCSKYNHKYHTMCITKYIQHANERKVFKCKECRDILSHVNAK